ncbi:MAG: hypothetical protein HY593_02090, partial [Candidatus Omnitrophica bacterium]|nr:hypothetical protein [Candidatus Omnitrophota bacterium]
YTETGTLEGTARDTNGDGKPDQFKKLVKGRELVLKEYDRNFDGKIDKRVLAQWDVIRTQPGAPGIPGYRNVQREEDNDFDGKIDAYREKGVKDSTAKIGQKMDPEVSWKAKRP